MIFTSFGCVGGIDMILTSVGGGGVFADGAERATQPSKAKVAAVNERRSMRDALRDPMPFERPHIMCDQLACRNLHTITLPRNQ